VRVRPIGAAAFLAVALASCGPTYVDGDVVDRIEAEATTITFPSIDRGAPLGALLDEIEILMSDLDERIIDQRGHVEVLTRIDDLWRIAEDRIRSDDPNDLFNFQQAIDLARSGVDRRRPADASKGYKIFVEVVDAYSPTGT
jgi:hypothetical protein